MTKNNKSSWIFSFRPRIPRDFLISLVFLSKNLVKSHEKSNNKQQSRIIMLLWYDFYNFLLKEKLSQLRSMCQSVTQCIRRLLLSPWRKFVAGLWKFQYWSINELKRQRAARPFLSVTIDWQIFCICTIALYRIRLN